MSSWGALAVAEEAAPEPGTDAEAAPAEAEAAPVEAEAPAEAETPAEAEAAPAEAAPTGRATPGGNRPQASEAAVRLGRVELVLIQNEDPESALEFGQELVEQDGDSARIRMLFGACRMRLGQGAQALEQFNRAVELSEDDPSTHLRALYNVARALAAAGQHAQAAEAYGRYVAYARAHTDLPSFIESAERRAATLRARAEGAAPSRRRR